MMEALDMQTPVTDVFTSQEARKLQNCARYWQNDMVINEFSLNFFTIQLGYLGYF